MIERSLLAAYDAVDASFAAAHTQPALVRAIEEWDVVKRGVIAHVERTGVAFRQDTASAEARAAADAAVAQSAAAQSRDVAIKRRLLQHPLRGALERTFGAFLFARWEVDVLAFEPAQEADLVREAALYNEYTSLLAAARTSFQGASCSLNDLAGFAEHPDRSVRRAASEASWGAFDEHGAALDRIFDELVRCRAEMAAALGYDSFVELGYRKMGRTDYGPADVARFRDAIRVDIVPLAEQIMAAKAEALGVDAAMPWDEQVFDRLPSPRSPASSEAMQRACADGFGALHPELGAFAELMLERRLLDLEPRPAKGAGAFCAFFPDVRMPFVFVNRSGTSRDTTSVVHEMGHAFQNYASRNKALVEYVLPTMEAGEIHSMAMEYLMWPQYERFAGEDADRFRSQHLRSMLLTLPYIAAVDHFQELVYETPDATPAERHAMWRSVEQRYLPYRSSGGIPYVARGGMWQRQRHIYGYPFYYIDYGLAMCCALQFWVASRTDHRTAVETYVALCKRGGELPFLELVASAGLRSPFEPGALCGIAEHARAFLAARPQA
jgi:M3 family oligoendopeptidase